MIINTGVKKSSGRFLKYGLWWHGASDPASNELDMIKRGGRWEKKDGTMAGEGLYFHFRKFQEIVWANRIWSKGPFVNYWAEKCLEVYIHNTYIGVMGCAASGKSDSFGCNVITDWYGNHSHMTVLVSSTEREMLELRIWGMIKKYHKLAKRDRKWIPGNLIEGKQRIITDAKAEFTEGRDFKNGIMGVACKKGNVYVGLGSMIGIHNKMVTLVADEANLMPRAFLDSTSNLSKCEKFKLIALGNPNETTNAHGAICEPEIGLGGWEGGIDQNPGTKTWKTRWPNGICLQLPGSDSPNMMAPPEDPPPFPFLVTRQQMIDDAAIWGVDDWHYTMMNEARMPRGQGSRRVLTRQACIKFGAFEKPNFRDSRITKIAFLDAAYRGVGGDRCVFGELNFGREIEDSNELHASNLLTNVVSQETKPPPGRQIIALVDLVTIPIEATKDSDTPEDQIAQFVKMQLANRGIEHNNFFYDAGMRTSLVSAFARHGMIHTETIDCGGKPSEDFVSSEIQKKCVDYYSKFVTELWYSVRYVVEARQFRGMREDVCSEFSQREWKMVSGNRIEVETKEEMKVKTGRSPDLADSVAIGILGARRRGFTIKRLGNPSPNSTTEAWKRKLRARSEALKRNGNLSFN
jgi:hypothetical protein